MNVQEVVKRGGSVIDVRTPEEFCEGNVSGSVNIPLHQLASRIQEISQLPSPLVLCCASGSRSARAQQFLLDKGVKEVLNGGSWREVDTYRKN